MSYNLGRVMDELILVFHKYSGKEGNKYKLSKTELRTLLETELLGSQADCQDALEVDKTLKNLDQNKDNEVDFEEFVSLVAMLTIARNKSSKGPEELKKSSKLNKSMMSLINVFHKYSGKEGDKDKLNKGELKTLLQTELSDMLKDPKDPSAVNKIMADLDMNQDGEADFQEFVTLISALTVISNEFFEEYDKN
ncbi:protein S100-Z-like [Mastacembelus armatus]|uniref:Protein S100-Z-like n=1 Tax=Mastacembelus armatus TaxID=205130 RepID=A0A3Q3MBT0_9TELE|nr:protein S100-Z-like [Mastacembelus armatus]